MGIAGILLILMALIIGGVGWLLRWRTGLPRGEVIQEDMSGVRASPPLSAPRYGLSGRPDYLMRHGGFLIPVEVKSAPAPPRPYPSHVMQLIAYCLLVEETFGLRPPYGWIRYRDRSFRVNYTLELRRELLNVLDSMRRDLERGEAHRQHRSPARCRACGFRAICEESLAGWRDLKRSGPGRGSSDSDAGNVPWRPSGPGRPRDARTAPARSGAPPGKGADRHPESGP